MLVGRTTKGSVLGAVNFQVGGGHWFPLPVFGWFTKDERSLEGTGVARQILAPLTTTDDVREEAKIDHVVKIVRDLMT